MRSLSPNEWEQVKAVAFMIFTLALLFFIFFALVSCSSDGKMFGLIPMPGGERSPDPIESNHQIRWALAPLAGTATLALIGGAILLFVTQGRRGWIPVALGVGLAIVNVFVILAVKSWIVWIVLSVTTILSVMAGVYSWRRTHHEHDEECMKWARTQDGSKSSDGPTSDSPSPASASAT